MWIMMDDNKSWHILWYLDCKCIPSLKSIFDQIFKSTIVEHSTWLSAKLQADESSRQGIRILEMATGQWVFPDSRSTLNCHISKSTIAKKFIASLDYTPGYRKISKPDEGGILHIMVSHMTAGPVYNLNSSSKIWIPMIIWLFPRKLKPT